ncbi:hypothetical protein [Aureliella helgolandensis]|uniref:Uncharacterized protein n=1 Tax=Aureliella helgolandensis TaxID=2527968 RepID=A0A518G3W1_9BACT|nr:hypothetical protein [Aureliella helgolandensis]QDV23288.1 hypothetical protein Q31a_15860 [Aureliella helgolandensis]
MNRLLKWAVAPVVAIATLSVAGSQEARAQFGIGINIGSYGYSNYQPGYRSYAPIGPAIGYGSTRSSYSHRQHYHGYPSAYPSVGYGNVGYHSSHYRAPSVRGYRGSYGPIVHGHHHHHHCD